MNRKIRILVVDDSPLVRQVLSQGLNLDPALEVVATAADPYEARSQILAHEPDVMTLDVEMPRMDGLEFLRRLMPQHPMPVVMVSSQTEKGKRTTLDCLEAGAVDFVHKSSTSVGGLNALMDELRTKVKIAAGANVAHWKQHRPELLARLAKPTTSSPASARQVVAIGASTGGTEAIKVVLSRLPADFPGVVIVQHMPAGFTRIFADRLNQLSPLEVKEAVSGDRVLPGRALVAPGGLQMRLTRIDGQLQVVCSQEAPQSGHCPSVDVLLHSVAQTAAGDGLGVVLTGMGADGADGLLAMRQAGARTLAQDAATSVVFGMPRAAFQRGGAERLIPLGEVAPELLRLVTERRT